MTDTMSIFDVRWYHGSSTRFDRWCFPPPRPLSRLGSHTAVFFASNKNYTENSGPIVYQTRLNPGANVLDLRQRSPHVDAFRHHLIASNERAKLLFSPGSGANWENLVGNGFIFQPPLYSHEQQSLLQGHERWLTHKRPADEDAFWAVRNIQREWIEAFVQTARDTGWHGLVLREGTQRAKGFKVSDILCVLRSGVIPDVTERVRI